MPLTNFPNGISSYGVPVIGSAGLLRQGTYYFVDSNNGSDGNTGTDPSAALATVDAAVNKCTANAGDTIIALPGHAETVTAADGIDLDVAGVSVIGIGVGTQKPTITFTTATTADVEVAAANVEVTGFRFVCNIASQVAMVTVAATGDGAHIHHNDFLEGSATGVTMLLLGDADGVIVEDNTFYAATAGNYDEAIHINAAVDRLIIRRNNIYGNFDDAAIHNPTGNVATQLIITDNNVTNTLAGAHAIELVSACTGMIVGNRLFSNALATSLDPGACYTADNLWAAGSDSPAYPVPSGRQEPILVSKATGDMSSGYGTGDSPVTLFTVTGTVMARAVGEVTTNLTSASNTGTISLGVSDAAAALIPAATADGTELQAGDVWFNATSGSKAGVLPDDGSWVVIAAGADIVMTIATNNITAGGITTYVQYVPLSAGASIVAA